MTREEILEQAKVGGNAVVRLPIKEVQSHESYLFPLVVCGQYDNHGLAVNCDNVISIEPPPKSDTEKLADALADIEAMQKRIDAFSDFVVEGMNAKEKRERDLASALAEIERLKTAYKVTAKAFTIADERAKCAEIELYSLKNVKEDPNPWRDHEGDDMPCDGDLEVDYVLRDGFERRKRAGKLEWTTNIHGSSRIIRWRPHVEVG